MSWNKLPWDIQVLIFRELADLPQVPEYWTRCDWYWGWRGRIRWKLDCWSLQLVSRSWNQGLRQAILEKNAAERVIYWMDESVAMEAIHRVVKKRGILVQQQECRQTTPRRNVPFNHDVESTAKTSMHKSLMAATMQSHVTSMRRLLDEAGLDSSIALEGWVDNPHPFSQDAEALANTSLVDTLLVAATFRGHVACMRLLLDEHGADCNIAPVGWVDNLVSIAILSRNIDAVKLLIDAGADMGRPLLQGEEYIQHHANTPLGIAVMDEHVPSVELLLQRGADPKFTIYAGSFGEPVDDPWEFATRHEDRGRPRLLEVFLRHGMFPDHSSYEQGSHPVILAMRAFNVECAAILVRAGAVPEDYDEYVQSDTDSRFLWAAEEVRNMLNEWKRLQAQPSKGKGKFGVVGDWIQRIRLKVAKK